MKNFFKIDTRLDLSPAIRWGLFGRVGYFVFSPRNNLKCFLKWKYKAAPKRGVAFSIGVFGAGIQ